MTHRVQLLHRKKMLTAAKRVSKKLLMKKTNDKAAAAAFIIVSVKFKRDRHCTQPCNECSTAEMYTNDSHLYEH